MTKYPMRSKEFISELFSPDKAINLTWGDPYHAETWLPQHKKLRVTFTDVGHGLFAIEFSVGDQFELTGEGNVSVIFATVIEAIKQFVNKNTGIKGLYFTADEQSRARMYDTLAKRVARQVGWHVVPYDEMVKNKKYQTPMSYGDFLFVIEPGQDKHQDAQKPQHSEFMPIWYVYSVEDKTAPVIKIKAKKSIDAEYYVTKTVPEYKTLDRMGIGAGKAPPGWGDITDMGTVKYPPKPAPRVLNPLEKRLKDKFDSETNS